MENQVEGVGRRPQSKPVNAPHAVAPSFSNERERVIYDRIKQEPAFKGFNVTPSYIRAEQKIVNGSGVYNFPIVKDSNADTPTEKKMDRKDFFVATGLGFFLIKRNKLKIGVEVLQTYPNAQVFVDDTVNFVGADLEAFYNGHLRMQIGQKVIMEALDLNRFRNVGSVVQIASIPQSSRTEKDGFIELTPQMTLDGDGKTNIQIYVPIDGNARVQNTLANTDNVAVLYLRGFLITKF